MLARSRGAGSKATSPPLGGAFSEVSLQEVGGFSGITLDGVTFSGEGDVASDAGVGVAAPATSFGLSSGFSSLISFRAVFFFLIFLHRIRRTGAVGRHVAFEACRHVSEDWKVCRNRNHT